MEYKQFENILIEDLVWRKKEISDLILIAEKEETVVLLKSIILLLYAHWEGYIKKSSKGYLKFIADNKVRIAELTINFKAVCLKGVSKEVLNSNNTLSLANELKLMEKYSNLSNYTFDKKIKIDLDDEKEKSIVDTQDNLNPSVFKNILQLIGLTYNKEYEAHEKYIDSYLLGNRNSIGHGNKKILTEEDFNLEINSIKRLRDVLFLIMDNYQEELLEFARNRYFIQSNSEENSETINLFLKHTETKLNVNFKEIKTKYQ